MRSARYNEGSTVSVVIPCYNAEAWIEEALQSCFAQTHQPLEIIVVDDGSTDGSLEILERYKSQIRLESGPNRGGNYARNIGFALSKGKYVQFLDADDILLPHKIERQVCFLEETKADVVYGDWQHKFHLLNGISYLGEVQSSNHQTDVLHSLLAGWWVAPAALLFRQDCLLNRVKWDESLRAAQDKDFFISVALSGANIKYQAGCFSIYRRYGNITVSTSHKQRWLENHLKVLQKAEAALEAKHRLSPAYRRALAGSYFFLARNFYDIDRKAFSHLLEKALTLIPDFQPEGTFTYRLIQRTLGFSFAEQLTSYKRRVSRSLHTRTFKTP